ncbi:complement factor H-related protein 1-like [Nelusetta ayraudi]|uniref:complement factor H-related protein 1-like n=1 Tax=Nelusetta ayraudi TaxID=303726 RepID=UPI003F717CEA
MSSFAGLLLILLACSPGALRAQVRGSQCHAPRLDGGYFIPHRLVFDNGSTIIYACDEGHKPMADRWFVTSTCSDGDWSPRPLCVDAKACFLPEIPHARILQPDAWYPEGDKIRIQCDEGYEEKNFDATAVCSDGIWISVPHCKRDPYACGPPPQIPHAVVIDQDYKDVFKLDSVVRYQCEDGYTMVESSHNNTICDYGNWTTGPTCRRTSGTGHGGTTEDITVTRPDSGAGGTAGVATDTPGGAHSGSTDGGQSGPTENIPVHACGNPPLVSNGELVDRTDIVLRYKCVRYYTLGTQPNTVTCQRNGQWSSLPVCRANFCQLNPGFYLQEHVTLNQAVFLNFGERKEIQCNYFKYNYYYTSSVHCNNGRVTWSPCCYPYDRRDYYCVGRVA